MASIGDVSRIIPPLYTRSHTDFIYDTDLIDVNGPISGFRYIFDRPLARPHCAPFLRECHGYDCTWQCLETVPEMMGREAPLLDLFNMSKRESNRTSDSKKTRARKQRVTGTRNGSAMLHGSHVRVLVQTTKKRMVERSQVCAHWQQW